MHVFASILSNSPTKIFQTSINALIGESLNNGKQKSSLIVVHVVLQVTAVEKKQKIMQACNLQ
jgi:hypothetical protein